MKFEIHKCDSCGKRRPAWQSVSGVGIVCKICALEVAK